MFEVIATYRADFREQLVARFSDADEAYELARQIAVHRRAVIIRAWVREVREAASEK
jgi:hypothetical protein